MIDLKRLVQCENEFPATFADVIERPYGLLLHKEALLPYLESRGYEVVE